MVLLRFTLFDESNLLIDSFKNRFFLLVEDTLVLFDQILPLGVDRDDQRTKLLDSVDP